MEPGIDPDNPLTDVLGRIAGLAEVERVTLEALLDQFGEAAFVPALMVPALIVVSPLASIFFLCTILGLTMALVAAQILIGRRRLWLPRVLLRRSISGAGLGRLLTHLRRPAAWLDRQTRPRLRVFSHWPLSMVAPLGAMISGLMMPFLELVPLSASILGAAITLFSVSLLSRDGLFVLVGLGFMAIASVIPVVVIYRFS